MLYDPSRWLVSYMLLGAYIIETWIYFGMFKEWYMKCHYKYDVINEYV